MDEVVLKKDLVPNPNNWFETLVDTKALLAIWNNDYLASQVQTWTGEPLNSWFVKDSKNYKKTNGLILPRAIISEGSIGFINGRHRTRWLIECDFSVLPLLLDVNSYIYTYENGLLVRRAWEGETITNSMVGIE